MSNNNRLVVVLGMHRSGTSAITRALSVLGVRLGEHLMPPTPGVNEKGYFEDLDIHALNSEMLQALSMAWHSLTRIEAHHVALLREQGYVTRALGLLRTKLQEHGTYGFKDPRVAKLLPFWSEVFANGEFDVSFVIALRNPLSVADSLTKRDSFEKEKSHLLWLEHLMNALLHSQGARRVFVDYDHFLADAPSALASLSEHLQLEIDQEALQVYQEDFLDPALSHAAYTVADLASAPSCPPLVRDIYTSLHDIALTTPTWQPSEAATAVTGWQTRMGELVPVLALIDRLDDHQERSKQAMKAQNATLVESIQLLASRGIQTPRSACDGAWYLKRYPDVANAGMDPYQHYLSHGIKEGRWPVPDLAQHLRQLCQAGLDDIIKQREHARNQLDEVLQRERAQESALRDELKQALSEAQERERAGLERYTQLLEMLNAINSRLRSVNSKQTPSGELETVEQHPTQ